MCIIPEIITSGQEIMLHCYTPTTCSQAAFLQLAPTAPCPGVSSSQARWQSDKMNADRPLTSTTLLPTQSNSALSKSLSTMHKMANSCTSIAAASILAHVRTYYELLLLKKMKGTVHPLFCVIMRHMSGHACSWDMTIVTGHDTHNRGDHACNMAGYAHNTFIHGKKMAARLLDRTMLERVGDKVV